MTIRPLSFVLLVAVVAYLPLKALGRTTYACRANSTTLWAMQMAPPFSSPDHRKSLKVRKDHAFEVFEDGKLIGFVRLAGLSAGIEIAWSGDSKAFFICWSNGGAVGGYSLRTFVIENHQVEETIGSHQAEALFRQKHYCRTRGNNVFGLTWIDGSENLFVVTEVYPTSDCGREMSKYAGYLVKADDGNILQTYSEKQVERVKRSCPRTSAQLHAAVSAR